MSDGSRLSGRQAGSAPQARQEAQGPGPAPEGGAEEVDAYVEERAAAQRRKIDLSMARKRGYAPSADPQDRAIMDATPQRTDSRYDPKRW